MIMGAVYKIFALCYATIYVQAMPNLDTRPTHVGLGRRSELRSTLDTRSGDTSPQGGANNQAHRARGRDVPPPL